MARRFLHASSLLLAAFLAGAALADPIPVETFFRKAEYGHPSLSPSGRYLAVITPVKDRLESGLYQRERGRFVMDRDGSNSQPMGGYLRVVPGTDHVLRIASTSGTGYQMQRVDTRTGAYTITTTFAGPPGRVYSWVLDFDHVPRAAMVADLREDNSAWYVRKNAQSPWQLVREAKYGGLRTAPLLFSPDGKTLYVRSEEHGDRTVIVEYDVEAGTMGKPFIQHPERDVVGFFRYNVGDRRLLGFSYVDDVPATAWFDADHAAVQKAIDSALPGAVNRIDRGRDGTGHRWLVDSYSDRNPGSAYLFEAKAGRLEKVLDYAPWIKAGEMSPQRWVRYKARDGFTVPALLTVPKDAAGMRVPLVVAIHGGPYVGAQSWGFTGKAQFLASRGYAVLEPQFRGTSGFGRKFFEAGFRAWGEAMQDDLEDGVKWAVAEGIADGRRVCFFGGSYGGYAAAWGAIRNRDLVRCSVAYIAVTSIDYMFDLTTTDMATYTRFSSEFAGRVGDPKSPADRAQWKRVSPLEHAEKVGVPILLAYGRNDARVPLEHGEAFRAALDKHGKPYEWVVYPDEGHGFNKSENVYDFYRRVEKFLARSLATP